MAIKSFRKLLEEKGITSYQISKSTGIPQSTLSDLSTGKTTVDEMKVGTAVKLANFLGITVEEFLEEASISYDYEEMICDLMEEINDCILTSNDIVQVLRHASSIKGYRPIIDWYYDDDTMNDMIYDMTVNERRQYKKDKPNLEKMTVQEFLNEMVEVNKII